jgi:hypothetical protein
MENHLLDKLTNRLLKPHSAMGIVVDDIRRIAVTPELVRDILACLGSSDTGDQSIALLFAECLIWPDRIDKRQQEELVSWLLNQTSGDSEAVRADGTLMLVRFRSQIPNYRDIMLRRLHSPDRWVGRAALIQYESYCQPGEVEPLEIFETDDDLCERHMGSQALDYEYRNRALETIERVLGKTFPRIGSSEALSNGQTAYWWDWGPYHDWKKNELFKKKGWLEKLFH